MGKRVTHLIAGLGKGGAETMLYQSLKYRSQSDTSYQVVSFGETHYYEVFIRELGIEVVDLNLRKNPPSIFSKNCWGGLTYHSLDLEFTSPFINMFLRCLDIAGCFTPNKSAICCCVSQTVSSSILTSRRMLSSGW